MKYEAFYNHKKIEVETDEGLWKAKQIAIKELKVPKSKEGLVAIQSISSKEKQDFRFL